MAGGRSPAEKSKRFWIAMRGVILLAGSEAGLPIYEYTPRRIKQALIGNGSAGKIQVQGMVQHILGLAEAPEPVDVTDALAAAICHAQAINSPLMEKCKV